MNYQEQIRSVKDYIRLPLCYDHWYVAGLKEEFDQKPTAKTLLERSIVFYRTEAGELVATMALGTRLTAALRECPAKTKYPTASCTSIL